MKMPKHSLRKIVTFLNNADEDGGFWLPNIHRPFVWSEDQMCRLFDSIMREYPISTLLIWKTKNAIRRRKFIDNFKREMLTHLSEFYVPEDDKKKCLVLDGQQRLQSLYIGLMGSYEGRELYLDILSGEIAAPDDVKYKFAFLEPSSTFFPHLKFKDIVFSPLNALTLANRIIDQAGRPLTDIERQKIAEHVAPPSRCSETTTAFPTKNWTVSRIDLSTPRTMWSRCLSAPTQAGQARQVRPVVFTVDLHLGRRRRRDGRLPGPTEPTWLRVSARLRAQDVSHSA